MVDILVIGAGPSGLSCAIEAQKAGLSSIVLEKGSLVDYLRRFPSNLIWFSTPELLEIGGIPFVISTVRPTRVDTLNYYQKVVRHFALDIRSHDAVTGISRQGSGFVVTTVQGGRYGAENVVVATGYFDNPNKLEVRGESLPHVLHSYDEPFKYFNADVVVVGGKNSAVETALDLYRHGVRVTLIHRGEKLSDGVKYWILPDFENRVKAGEIKAYFGSRVKEIRERSVFVETPEGEKELPGDFLFVLIGYQPDTQLLRAIGVEILPDSLAPRADEKTYETNVKGLFAAGSVVAGRNTNKIFVENGRLHGPAIVSAILARKGKIH